MVAASWTLAPTSSVDDEGDSETDATGATGGGDVAVVLPAATFERPPNTAFMFSVPRNATSWKL
jgi:hypothetical protein